MSARELPGAAGAVAELVAGAAEAVQVEREAAAGRQLDLLPVPEGRLLTAVEARSEADRLHGRGPGRPPGATNRSTREMREYLLARGVHPLHALMTWATMTPEELAARLSCSRAEAFDRLVGIWKELGPYFAPKLAPTDGQGNAVPMLAIQIGSGAGAPGVGAAGDVPPWLRFYGPLVEGEAARAEGEADQGLSAEAASPSHAPSSHGSGKP